MGGGTRMTSTERLAIVLGVPVDRIDMAGAVDRVEAFIRAGRRTGRTHHVATVNLDFAVEARRDAEFRRILLDADLHTADGMPLVWASRVLGHPIPERVTGADLVDRLAGRAAARGYSFYLLGGAPGIGVRAARALQRRHPKLRIAGVASPPFSARAETPPEMLADLRAARPDVLLVGLGAPKQEKWIDSHRDRLGVPVAIGVGGTFDLLARAKRRAPAAVQRAGLEWLFRFAQEPRRLGKRYLADGLQLGPLLVRQRAATSRRGPAGTVTSPVRENGRAIVRVTGRLDRRAAAELARVGAGVLDASAHLAVDVSQTTAVDGVGLGALAALRRDCRARGVRFSLVAPSPAVARAMQRLGMMPFFDVGEPDGADAAPARARVGS